MSGVQRPAPLILPVSLSCRPFFTDAASASHRRRYCGQTWYDSLVIELRRRLSKGLPVQANYVFAKGLSTSQISWRVQREKVTNTTLPHAFKVNWLWELPFGRNRLLFNSIGGVLDKIIGGWEFHGTGRIQSGNLLNFGNVRLVGMTADELRKSVGIWHDDAAKLTYYLPKDIIDNTIKAYNVSATTSTGYSTSFGVPTGRYVAPVNTQDCIQIVSGQCAPLTLYIRGPKFTRFDLSLVKRIYFTERVNFELRGGFLNAFNNINFYGATCASSAQTCGQVTSAYTDSNQQQDPGGRLIQFVGRIAVESAARLRLAGRSCRKRSFDCRRLLPDQGSNT